jgi:murein DD-endopeptidase MepM/ murein hydrolase activator NlpD
MNMNIRYRFLWLILMVSAALAVAEDTVHIIQRGETIYSLARTYGVNSQDILNLNGITDPKKIQAGQRIRIPGAAAAPTQGRFLQDHRVSPGETFYGLARQYGVSQQSLRSANNLSEDYILKVGDLLHIPETGSAIPLAPIAVPPAAIPQWDIPSGEDFTAPAAIPLPPESPYRSFPFDGLAGSEIRSTAPRVVDASVHWPINAREIAYMTGKLTGVVLLGERLESVKSLTPGVVISAGPYRGFGRVAIIQNAGGYLYVYGGCENLSVKEGDRVSTGTELGRLGADVLTERPQLFFLVYRNSISVDPAAAPRS